MNKTNNQEYITIPVPKKMCIAHTSKNGEEWVKILVPPESSINYDTEWKAFAVKPEQVTEKSSSINILKIKKNITIRLSYCDKKDIKDRNPEFISALFVLGRWLKWHRFMRFVNINPDSIVMFNLNCPSFKIKDDFIQLNEKTKINSYGYINRLPLFIK